MENLVSNIPPLLSLSLFLPYHISLSRTEVSKREARLMRLARGGVRETKARERERRRRSLEEEEAYLV